MICLVYKHDAPHGAKTSCCKRQTARNVSKDKELLHKIKEVRGSIGGKIHLRIFGVTKDRQNKIHE